MSFAKCVILALLFSISFMANAGWHGGKVVQVSVGYDGQTIAFVLDGWNRTNCTCYSSWPNQMCLDINRDTAAFEKSMLLSAIARDTIINVHIDEVSCKVVGLYEISE